MKKFALLLIVALVLTAAVVVVNIRIHAQTPAQPLMAEIPSDLENDNPVPMTLQWGQDGKSYYYFSWGVKPTAGYRLEYGGLENNVLTIRAISPGSEDFVAQVLTYPKLMLVLPKGNYTYRVVDQFGREVKSIFQPEREPMAFKVIFPHEKRWSVRRVWREPDQENAGKSRAQIAMEALLAQPEMGLYAQQGLQVLSTSSKGNKCYVLMNKSYIQLGYKEKATLTEAMQRTVMGLKIKGMKKIEVVTEAKQMPMVANQ